MKRVISLLFIGIILVSTGYASDRKWQIKDSGSIPTTQTDTSIDEDAILLMLKEFYTEYITACCQNFTPNEEESTRSNLIDQYCTKALIGNIDYFGNPDNLQWLNCDPFLNAQDCDLKTLQTLQVSKDIRDNVYKVTYSWSSTQQTIILLIVIKTDDGYKIDAVLKN